MVPKAFTDLFEACNKCILSLEACRGAAETCEQKCSSDGQCLQGAQEFTKTARNCIASCEECIKACNTMLAEFMQEGHAEHKEAIDTCVKALGEAIQYCDDGIIKCADPNKCRVAVREAHDALDRAIKATDACIESCEKHEVFYKHIKK